MHLHFWLVAAAATFAGTGTESDAALPQGAFGWMADLAGHCWSAVYPDGTRDTQCYAEQFDHFLRGTIEIAAASGREPYRGDSVFVWDPASARITFHYWSSGGSSGTLTGQIEDGRIIFAGLSPSGNAAAARTVWTRTDPDSFRVVRQRQTADGWVDTLSLVYARSAGAPSARGPAAPEPVRR